MCLRQVVANKDSISIFFFDEIDTGIGGETALKIGKLLSEISRSSQVISITHLPQIAHHADHIVLVSKDTKTINGDTRTLSTAQFLEGTSKKKVIDSSEAIVSLMKQLDLKDYLESFYHCRYKKFFHALLKIIARVRDDPYLKIHGKYFTRETRVIVYAQFLESYKTVKLGSMAN